MSEASIVRPREAGCKSTRDLVSDELGSVLDRTQAIGPSVAARLSLGQVEPLTRIDVGEL